MLKLKTNNYGGDTSWDLKKNGSVVLRKGQYTYRSKENYEENLLISSDWHTFSIKDSWGDGICCGYGQGLYEVYYNGELIKQGGDFSFSESTTVPSNCAEFLVSDNRSGLNENKGGNSSIDNKAANMAAYLEGEEKALIEIEKMLSDAPPPKKAIPSDETKPKQNTKTNIQKNKL